MKIDLTCPVELWQYAMPTEDDAECTFVMNNLSDKVVVSVQVALNCYNQADELLFRQSERILGLKAGVGERFTLVILPSEWQGVEGVDLVIEKVWFDDATIWRKGNAPLAHYVPNNLPAGRALDELRFVAGKDAAGYPQVQDEVWMCVCGRANAPDSPRCCRCERRRDAVFASFTKENVNHIIAAHESKLAEAARKAREDNNILQENQEKQRAAKRRKRRQRIRLLTALLMTAAAAAVAVFWGIPTVQYNTAQDLLADGHYDQARAAFAELEEWKDSAAQMLECDYQKALSQLKEGGQEALETAEQAFLALGDYRDSADQALEAAYQLGGVYLEARSFESAAEKYQSLGDYKDSAVMLKETAYRQAEALMENGSYVAARVLFENLGDYSTAYERARACTYEIAKAQMDEGQYEAAISALEILGEYEDAPELIKQAYYAMAENAMQEENYANAGQWYQLAGDYADAQAKANDCIYQLAQQIKAEGDYEKAQELFEQISGYLDSEGQVQTCMYARAEALLKQGDFTGARELFGQITDYSDSQSRMDECSYELAMAALSAGDSAQAESMLGEIVDYEDAQKQLRILRYKLAESDLEKGQYESAIARYEALDGYKDSKTKIKLCRYRMAEAKLEAGDYDAALIAYTALNGYKDSESKIQFCHYQLALASREAGDYAAAMEAFAALGSYEDSRSMLEEVSLLQAEALLEKGDREAAIALLESMDSEKAHEKLLTLSMEEGRKLEEQGLYEQAAVLYEGLKGSSEAQNRASACRYQLAVQMKEAGDLPSAAAAFDALGDYEDAEEQSRLCWTEYYGSAPETARAAMDNEDYSAVVETLEGLMLSGELEALYQEAAYLQADRLYAEEKPYEALPFYQRAVGYRDTEDRKLDRRAYLILGQWQSTTGKEAVFRTDGTCDILGETLCFRVSNFSLYTGPDPENMTITHKLSSIDQKGMSLRDIRNGQDTVYKFSRVGEYDLARTRLPLPQAPVEASPAPTAEPAPEPTQVPDSEDEMLVTEDADGTLANAQED